MAATLRRRDASSDIHWMTGVSQPTDTRASLFSALFAGALEPESSLPDATALRELLQLPQGDSAKWDRDEEAGALTRALCGAHTVALVSAPVQSLEREWDTRTSGCFSLAVETADGTAPPLSVGADVGVFAGAPAGGPSLLAAATRALVELPHDAATAAERQARFESVLERVNRMSVEPRREAASSTALASAAVAAAVAVVQPSRTAAFSHSGNGALLFGQEHEDTALMLAAAGIPRSRAAEAARVCQDAATAGTMFAACEAHAHALRLVEHCGDDDRLASLIDASASDCLLAFLRRYSTAFLVLGRGGGLGEGLSLLQTQAVLHAWLRCLEFMADAYGLLNACSGDAQDASPPRGMDLVQRAAEVATRTHACAGGARAGLPSLDLPSLRELAAGLWRAAAGPVVSAMAGAVGLVPHGELPTAPVTAATFSFLRLPPCLDGLLRGEGIGGMKRRLQAAAAQLELLDACAVRAASALSCDEDASQLRLPTSGSDALRLYSGLPLLLERSSLRVREWSLSLDSVRDAPLAHDAPAIVTGRVRRALVSSAVRDARAAERSGADAARETDRAAKRAELVRLAEAASSSVARRVAATAAAKAEAAAYEAAVHATGARGSSPLKAAESEGQAELYSAARAGLLKAFGERLSRLEPREVGGDGREGGRDAVALALEALSSLGPRPASHAAALASELGVPWAAAPGVAQAQAESGGESVAHGLARTVLHPPLDLFRALPELEGLLPATVASTIRVTMLTPGGVDTVGPILGGESVALEQGRTLTRISSPPGGRSTLDLGHHLSGGASPDGCHHLMGHHLSDAPAFPPLAAHPPIPPAPLGNGPDVVTVSHTRVTQPAGGTSTIADQLYGREAVPLPPPAASSGRGSGVAAALQTAGPPAAEALVEKSARGRAMTGPRLSSPQASLALHHTGYDGAEGTDGTGIRVLQPESSSVGAVAALLRSDGAPSQHEDARRLSVAASSLSAATMESVQALLYGGGHPSLPDEEPRSGLPGQSSRGRGSSSVAVRSLLTRGLRGSGTLEVAAREAPLKGRAPASRLGTNEGSIDGSAVARLMDHDAGGAGRQAASTAAQSAGDAMARMARDLTTTLTASTPAAAPSLSDDGKGRTFIRSMLREEGAGNWLAAGTRAIGRPGLHEEGSPSDRSLLRLALGAPLTLRLAQIEAATLAAVVLHADLASHCTALRGWMLLGAGHVMGPFLSELRKAVAGAPEAIADPPLAAALAKRALGRAREDLGLAEQFSAFVAAATARIDAADAVAAGGAAPAMDIVADAPHVAERLCTALRKGAEDAHTTALVSHMHCFSYAPVQGGADAQGGGRRGGLEGVLYALRAVYDPSALPLQHGWAGEAVASGSPDRSGAGRLLALALTPATMARYSALHSFLLRISWAGAELRESWVALKGHRRALEAGGEAHALHTAHTLRHAATHLLAAVEGHLTAAVETGHAQVIAETGAVLRRAQQTGGGAGALAGLAAAYTNFTRGLLARALLPPIEEGRTGPARPPLAGDLLDALLSVIHELADMLKAVESGCGFNRASAARLEACGSEWTRLSSLLAAALRAASLSSLGGPVTDLLTRLG
jgi:hypothetical protein